MVVNSLPKTVTRQRRDCDLNPGPSAPESSTLTTRLPSHPRPIGWATKQKKTKTREKTAKKQLSAEYLRIWWGIVRGDGVLGYRRPDAVRRSASSTCRDAVPCWTPALLTNQAIKLIRQHSRQQPTTQFFTGRMRVPAAQPTASKHWRQKHRMQCW